MIHLCYTGYGWLVFAISFGISLLANLLTNHFFGSRYYAEHKWPLGAALMVSGMICSIIVLLLSQKNKARVLMDVKTGEVVEMRPVRDSFFFIPMKWWGFLLMIGGSGLAIYDLFLK